MTPTFADLQLHRVPEHLVPNEPRLGGSTVPVPPGRFAALTRSGTAVLGLPPGYRHAAGFVASVVDELRSLLRLPATHDCLVLPVPATTVADTVRSADPGWRTADLSWTSTPVATDVLGDLDIGFFCVAAVFGLPMGLTVVTLSPRAREFAPGLAGGCAPSTTDLMLLANAVRDLAETEPELLRGAVRTRFGIVQRWAATKPWVVEPLHRADHGLVATVHTMLAAEQVREIGDFLSNHHLAYGVTDDDTPCALRIGLSATVPVDDLERLLGLLAHLVSEVLG